MYTADHRQKIRQGYCSHIIDGGLNECPLLAEKYWVFLEEGPEMRLQLTLVLPVCTRHALYLRTMLNVHKSHLSKDYWELIDRSSASFYLIEESIEDDIY